MKKNLIRLILCLLIVGCSEDDDVQGTIVVGGPTGFSDGGGVVISDDPFIYTPTSTLQSQVDYPIGMIVSANKLTQGGAANTEFRDRLINDFNSVTAENDMKMANMFTGIDTYDWSDGDEIVAYAKANGLRVHGHTLVWHSSIPGWLNSFTGTDAEFEEQIKKYVQATVAHFAEEKMTVNGEEVSVVQGWDVINEAIDGAGLRSSLFLTKIGTDYVKKIYGWAREADADVKLFYNDYNIAGQTSKRNAILNMVGNLQADNLIDGVGLQMHVQYNFPQTSEIAQAVSDVAATGLLVHFSEVDIAVNSTNDITALTEDRAAEQEAKYKEVSTQYNMIPAAQQYGITVWGMRDGDSWISDGGTDWPLLFDDDYNFKVAHRGFAEGLSN